MALLGGPHSSDNKVISTYISPTAKLTKITVCIQGQHNNIWQTRPVKDHTDRNLTTLNPDTTIRNRDNLSGKQTRTSVRCLILQHLLTVKIAAE